METGNSLGCHEMQHLFVDSYGCCFYIELSFIWSDGKLIMFRQWASFWLQLCFVLASSMQQMKSAVMHWSMKSKLDCGSNWRTHAMQVYWKNWAGCFFRQKVCVKGFQFPFHSSLGCLHCDLMTWLREEKQRVQLTKLVFWFARHTHP